MARAGIEPAILRFSVAHSCQRSSQAKQGSDIGPFKVRHQSLCEPDGTLIRNLALPAGDVK